MVKKIIAVATAILMLCCMVPLAAFADDILDTCPKCGERTYETWQDFSTSVPDLGFPISIKRRHCTSCQYTYYDWNCMGYTGYKEFDSGSGNLIVDYLKEWKDKTFGKNATAKPYQTGGGSAGTGGVGRNPSGYDDNNGALIGSSGTQRVRATFKFFVKADSNGQPIESFSTGDSSIYATGTPGQVIITSSASNDHGVSFGGGYFPVIQEPGYYTLPEGTEVYNFQSYQGNTSYPSTPRVSTTLSGYGPSNAYRTLYISPTDTYTYFFYCSDFRNENKFSVGYSSTNGSGSTYSFHSGTNGRKVIHAPP